jgi:hypothetical protein
MSRSEPLPLDAYPSRTSTDIRYADLDRQGHVNNAVFSTFSEIGRVAFLYDPERPLAPDGASFVIARLAIDFRTSSSGRAPWTSALAYETSAAARSRSRRACSTKGDASRR